MEVQKARLLLRASCALAVASASGTDGGAADERVRLICSQWLLLRPPPRAMMRRRPQLHWTS